MQAAGPRPYTCPSCGTSKEEQPKFPHGEGPVSESKSRTEKTVARNNPGVLPGEWHQWAGHELYLLPSKAT